MKLWSMRTGSWKFLWIAQATLVYSCAAVPPAPVAPQRPSYSSDVTTTAPRTLEVEAGVFIDDEDMVDTPFAIKWGATETAELFVGWSPYVRVALREADESGVGDFVLGTRVRFLEEGPRRPAAAFQLTTKLPAADKDSGLGTGLVDFFGAAIVTKAFDRTTVNGFYQLGVLSDPAGGNVILEHDLAIAVGHPIVQNLGGFTELSVILTPNQNNEAVLWTLGMGYVVHPNVAFDSAVFVGLTDDTSRFAITFGTTVNVGRIGRWFQDDRGAK
ncbi:MAG: hypothetical protein OEN01_09005 [Candidatus Krumholzibacteria bacterium]|nr:hypothetical protein [Candidatus Krumholzibacteria bacterium]